jgi:hypothetical protein
MRRAYKLTRQKVGEYHQYRLVLPTAIGDRVWAAGIVTFACEITDEGILYRPAMPATKDQPAWLKP